MDEAERSAALARFEQRVAQIGADAPPLTRFPQECRFCGYRRVRLCAGARFGERAVDDALERLASDRFRARFRLRDAERASIEHYGTDGVRAHAVRFITERLAPAQPVRDGRQTPWRGHPVFIAQHATATCCRSCLERAHGISTGRALDADEQTYVVELIMRWLQDQFADREQTSGDVRAPGESQAPPSAATRQPDGAGEPGRPPADPQLRLL
jgi:hypothetical protein